MSHYYLETSSGKSCLYWSTRCKGITKWRCSYCGEHCCYSCQIKLGISACHKRIENIIDGKLVEVNKKLDKILEVNKKLDKILEVNEKLDKIYDLVEALVYAPPSETEYQNAKNNFYSQIKK